MPLFPDEELPTIGFRGNKKIVIPQNVNYIDKLRADIQQLEEQIEVLSEKIPDAIFKGTPQTLQALLFDIDALKSRLISLNAFYKSICPCFHHALFFSE